MVDIAIQLYTLRALEEPPWSLVERVGETTFGGVELYDPQFDALDDDGLERSRDALDETGLEIVGGHVGVERLEERFDETVTACRALGVDRLVVPTYDPDAFASREGVEGAAEHLSGLAGELAAEGVDLLYHNHTFEFDEVDGEVAFEAFADAATDALGFEPDTGLARHAGYDPERLLDLVADRAPLVHLTDANPGSDDGLHADPGTGVLDVEALADRARRNGADWLVYENGVTETPLDSLAYSEERFAAFAD